jgi:hypothetical protein
VWTRRVTEKYVSGAGRREQILSRVADERIVICLRPERVVAVASL